MTGLVRSAAVSCRIYRRNLYEGRGNGNRAAVESSTPRKIRPGGHSMGRNSELIRQWTLLRRLATRRDNHIPALAEEFQVNPRTIRRDLDALQAAGFPIYDDDANGTKCWRVNQEKLLEKLSRNALTLPELCALYVSRALLQGMAGPHA